MGCLGVTLAFRPGLLRSPGIFTIGLEAYLLGQRSQRGSKFNPIERRLFSHVTKACQGVLFASLQTVLALMQKTKTQQDLSVTVRVLDTLYEGGRTVSEAFKKNKPIVFEKLLPKWSD